VKKTVTEVRLTFEAGRISGQGNDRAGPFYWDGTYKFSKGSGHHVIWACSLKKCYIGRHTLSYEGIYNSYETELKFRGDCNTNYIKDRTFELSIDPPLQVAPFVPQTKEEEPMSPHLEGDPLAPTSE